MARKTRSWKAWLGWIAIGCAGLACLLVAGVMVFGYLITGGGCGADNVRRVASPDGQWEAVSYDANCGALSRYHTEVSVVRPGERLSAYGNVFSAAWGSARTTWISADTVQVTYSTPGPITKVEKKRGPVTIVYKLAS